MNNRTKLTQAMPVYANKHVSGKKPNVNLIYSKPNIKKNTNSSIDLKSNKTNKKKYDFHEEYLRKNSLGNKHESLDNYVIHYLNIESSARKKKTEYIYDKSITLDDKDPFDFKKNSNKLFIYYSNTELEVGNKIVISNITPITKILRSYDNNNNPSFEIPVTTNLMKIFINHNMPLDYSGNEIKISLSKIIGDNGPSLSSTFLGNIPVGLINQTYSIKTTVSLSELYTGSSLISYPSNYLDPSHNYLFVLLPIPMTQTYVLSNHNYSITFQSIGGIPLTDIVAEKNNIHEITEILENGFYINLPKQALIDERSGGYGVKIKKIKNVIQGYPNNNFYSIDLESTYTNIISARLLSIDFPNTQPTIINEVNNKFYWQNINDGDYVYSISIPQGNYLPEQLKAIIESLVSKTSRINISDKYSEFHYFTIDINQNTNIVTIKTFKKFEIEQPITNVNPTINTNSSLDIHPTGTLFILEFTVPSHGITSIDTEIIISGAIEHLGISATIINSIYKINSIIDSDKFTIKLPKINLAVNRSNSKGGKAVTIYIPELSKLRFDYSDTICSVLGFRNPGQTNSVTNYSIIHTNKDSYVDSNESGNNSIQLSGENYVLLLISQLNRINGNGIVKKFFSKINLCDLPGTVLYDSFVCTPLFFPEIIDKLTRLDISFRNKNGSLYNFNGVEHSFVLEFKSVVNKNNESNIHAKSAKIFK